MAPRHNPHHTRYPCTPIYRGWQSHDWHADAYYRQRP
ncbi:hypothetical protein BMETH_294_1 [methanotrophic bacterial endosymbiont of Bathymodiolus sp.]|nr:hypothetical protein BMETH_294_1 [methanotrophic bacterial endosymbiont of Bathymodiolus sp.]